MSQSTPAAPNGNLDTSLQHGVVTVHPGARRASPEAARIITGGEIRGSIIKLEYTAGGEKPRENTATITFGTLPSETDNTSADAAPHIDEQLTISPCSIKRISFPFTPHRTDKDSLSNIPSVLDAYLIKSSNRNDTYLILGNLLFKVADTRPIIGIHSSININIIGNCLYITHCTNPDILAYHRRCIDIRTGAEISHYDVQEPKTYPEAEMIPGKVRIENNNPMIGRVEKNKRDHKIEVASDKLNIPDIEGAGKIHQIRGHNNGGYTILQEVDNTYTGPASFRKRDDAQSTKTYILRRCAYNNSSFYAGISYATDQAYDQIPAEIRIDIPETFVLNILAAPDGNIARLYTADGGKTIRLSWKGQSKDVTQSLKQYFAQYKQYKNVGPSLVQGHLIFIQPNTIGFEAQDKIGKTGYETLYFNDRTGDKVGKQLVTTKHDLTTTMLDAGAIEEEDDMLAQEAQDLALYPEKRHAWARKFTYMLKILTDISQETGREADKDNPSSIISAHLARIANNTLTENDFAEIQERLDIISKYFYAKNQQQIEKGHIRTMPGTFPICFIVEKGRTPSTRDEFLMMERYLHAALEEKMGQLGLLSTDTPQLRTRRGITSDLLAIEYTQLENVLGDIMLNVEHPRR